MKFTKMHGIGNDYVYVNCLEETVRNPQELAKFVSDRHFGIGSDGLILIKPSQAADFEMAMYNADGSQGMMCGNGIRCVAKYVYEHGLTDKTVLCIETLAGMKYVELEIKDGNVERVRVNMGRPEFAARKIPVRYPAGADGAAACKDGQAVKEQVVNEPVIINGTAYRMTCVSMGNPHCVVYVEDVDGLEIEKIGPAFEHHACFPDRVNTEFVKVLDRHTVQMRVWERGSGETLACGTGACAVAAASVLNGLTDTSVRVRLSGGELDIRWDKEADLIYMAGPAETVFEGTIILPEAVR